MPLPLTHPARCGLSESCWLDLESIKVFGLSQRLTPGARLEAQGEGVWRLEIPAGPQGRYRLAQLDDYARLKRRDYLWHVPLRMELQARASAEVLPGTWGFGFWNDPFGMALFSGAEPLRLPTLPNAAWFFFASPHNYLSLRDDLPAEGFLATTFHSPRLPALLLAPTIVGLPLLIARPAVRLLRKMARRFVQQDGVRLPLTLSEWHTFVIDLNQERALFQVDGEKTLETALIPLGPLGFVLWLDNQYAAFRPDGRVGFGCLENPQPAWIEISGLVLDNPAGRD
jgi:hypothetical protein